MPALETTPPQDAEAPGDRSIQNPFEFYGQQVAAADLRSYRKNGPRPWTKALIDELVAEGIKGATVLDIGGGVGVIGHKLLDAGAAKVTNVEASPAYIAAAREESESRGHAGRVTFQLGDFVKLAGSIPPADIVTLDRVLNVYPDWERLASLAAEHARGTLGVVVPRDTPFVKLVIAGMNLVLRLRRQSIRAAVIPVDAIEQATARAGLAAHYSKAIGAWQVLVYRRPSSRS